MQINYLNKDIPWQDQDLGGKRPGKSLCVVRYGGFGDFLQTSSVLPCLKEQGWHITVNTTPNGYDILKHDPHIDAFFIQIKDQVDNVEIKDYWDKLEGNFSRFIQFSGSIEGELLALPGWKEYEWRKQKRHKVMNRDYFSQMHRIADVPLPPKPKFYTTELERKTAKKYISERAGFKIMWALSGSSLHKAYPFTDNVVAKLLLNTDAHIIFVGEELCQLLEDPWRNESRISRECGRMSIRDTLSLSQQVDMVVGVETGVLNCVAFEDVPKVMMLSHSSSVNIGGTWNNTTVLEPRGVKCYPCHKLHYSWSTCNRDKKTGGAMCAAGITPDRVYNAIVKQIAQRNAA